MNKKYPPNRLAGLSGHKLKGKTYEEVFGVTIAKQMKEKMRLAKLGKKRPPRSKSHIKNQSGKNHWHWKGGTSKHYKSGYYSANYKEWRKKVFERDKFTCQGCGKMGYITAHHIKSFAHYLKLRYEIINGITLCEDCHALTDNYRGRAKRWS